MAVAPGSSWDLKNSDPKAAITTMSAGVHYPDPCRCQFSHPPRFQIFYKILGSSDFIFGSFDRASKSWGTNGYGQSVSTSGSVGSPTTGSEAVGNTPPMIRLLLGLIISMLMLIMLHLKSQATDMWVLNLLYFWVFYFCNWDRIIWWFEFFLLEFGAILSSLDGNCWIWKSGWFFFWVFGLITSVWA